MVLVQLRWCALGHPRSRRWRFDVREGVGTAGNSLVARLAVPDTGGVTLDRVLAAEGAGVAGVLRDFDLLHLLTERGTITEGFTLVAVRSLEGVSSMFEGSSVPGTVFTGDSDLCKMLLACVRGMRTRRAGGSRGSAGLSQKGRVWSLGVERTFGSLRHCVEADLFAMTESRWVLSQMARRESSIWSGAEIQAEVF